MRRLAGRFIAFEGPDGSGKTTQYRRLISLLQQRGLTVCEVREPGGTPIGESIRQILLHTKDEMTLRCEMLLYMASRSQLVEQRIRPALKRGEVVMADRFVSSTLAYQGSAGGIPIPEIKAVADVAIQGAYPDLVIIFDVDEETAARRISPLLADVSSTRETKGLDRIESRGREFHRKVREGYLEQARQAPDRHLVIDARRSADEVWQSLLDALGERFEA
ncbi:MAG: dTMP kinase [Phycisphaerales bacterium]|nr:MAG: dTMP kinase [Phycisphaerales bacterium]